MDGTEPYFTIDGVCEAFSFSRSTFYRMLADPDSGLRELVVRVPPITGRLRIPRAAFEAWLHASRVRGPRRRRTP